jgi:hypothetical protein
MVEWDQPRVMTVFEVQRDGHALGNRDVRTRLARQQIMDLGQ